MDYKVLTEREKNDLAVKYTPLVNKLINQYYSKGHIGGLTGWDQISSMAWEGFAIAINTFDSERSTMSFTQFAAFSIRNNILTSLDNELRTVKLSAYAQKKATEKGESLFNSVSFSGERERDDDNFIGAPKRKDWLNLRQEDKFSDGDIFETLYSKLEDNFSVRDCEIFYRSFGLKDFDDEKGKDIADSFNISRSLVSIKLKTIISFIQRDTELCEILSNLLK
jgi:RNA polymerase sigma factor (sigma-70 family)